MNILIIHKGEMGTGSLSVEEWESTHESQWKTTQFFFLERVCLEGRS